MSSLKYLSLGLGMGLSLGISVSSTAATLDEKLSEQWSRYAGASALARDHIGRQAQTIGRAEWEALLTPSTGLELSAQDLSSLRQSQAQLAMAARLENEKGSVLDLRLVRGAGRAGEFCRVLPKGGMLHVHPWGTLDQATAAQILDFTNPLIKPTKLREILGDPAGPQFLYPGELDFLSAYADLTPYQGLSAGDQQKVQSLFFLPERTAGPYEFKRFAGTFALVSQLIFSNPQKDPSPLMWDAFFRRAQANGLRYAEISGNVPKALTLPKLLVWQKNYQTAYGVTGVQLGAFNRTGDVEKNRLTMKDLLALPVSDAFLGINLVADESEHPMLESGQAVYAQLLAARADGLTRLHATVHAGELGDPRNLRDAMILGAERIGHGVNLSDDPVALQFAINHQLGLEANLTSNLRLNAFPEVKTHPFLSFLRMGLKVSLATDDEGIFQIDFNHECEAALAETDLNWVEFKQLLINSIDTSFSPEPQKGKLLADLLSDLQLF